MSTDPPFELNPQLLDEFYAEADEHLIRIRQALLQLEASVGKTQPEPKIIEEFFLHIHSFKGISALVGLGAAEAVAHATEDFLRLMRHGKAPLSGAGLETLTAAARKLEQIVAAFRARQPLPGYDSLLAELKQECDRVSLTAAAMGTVTPPGGTTAPDQALIGSIEEAKVRGLLLWKYTFSPTRALDAKGINVNSVRKRLADVGEILQATPLVRGHGLIAFEFLVAARETPTDLAAWEALGVTIQRLEEEPQKPAALSEASAQSAVEHSPFLAPSHVVRLGLERLDELMRITGEMVIHRSRLEMQLSRLKQREPQADLRGVEEVGGSLSRSLRELRESIMRVRLVPVAEIFARMPFVVRDLAHQAQKKVRLQLVGQETAMDKYVIERLKDPLLHLVRNAFSHGVESAVDRAAAGKPEEATIELKASTVGDSVVVHVRDDGRGINPRAIVERAQTLGLEIPENVDHEAILQILCTPGFSTRRDADRAAGRGVGMTVVRTTVRELGGSLSLDSEEGRWTSFTIRLPLTLAIAEAFIVTAAGQTFAIPQGLIQEILQVTEGQIQFVNGIEVVPYREGVLPIVRLAKLFRLPSAERPKSCLLVVGSDRGCVGLFTDDVLGQREVVIHALRDPLIQVRGVSGATELGDGRPVLILDGAALTAGAVRPLQRKPAGADTFAHAGRS